ncbi:MULTISPECIES: WXG100 family type VII secretion target [unclassified Streptomyces]|uniref:WXG100 family type VII secretion target n=1 Tax=unclassified Streptomyces TaxID=2593676 RepID=UPI00114CBFC2|nr:MULTISPECIES: hypothetical protein [unclassified Streptomyces]MYS23328.1 hypothetical protein [Streptomyces sp. SID4948]
MSSILTTLSTAVGEINTDIGDIMTRLNSLKLTWTGDSATVMNDFNSRWYKAVTDLYGTQMDPAIGILNILTSGLAQAVENYNECEQNVANMFDQFEKTLTAGTGGDGGTPVDDPYGIPEKNYHTTSINETF